MQPPPSTGAQAGLAPSNVPQSSATGKTQVIANEFGIRKKSIKLTKLPDGRFTLTFLFDSYVDKLGISILILFKEVEDPVFKITKSYPFEMGFKFQ